MLLGIVVQECDTIPELPAGEWNLSTYLVFLRLEARCCQRPRNSTDIEEL